MQGKTLLLSATQVSAALAKFSDAGTLGWANQTLQLQLAKV